jgi:hypothetical protein
MNGLEEINQMIGGNVTDDIIVNMDGGVGGSWKVNKITPETYEKMNKEFEEEGLAFRIIVPTQKEIDDWQQRN